MALLPHQRALGRLVRHLLPTQDEAGSIPAARTAPASANGRPAVFEAAYRGSSPCAGTSSTPRRQGEHGTPACAGTGRMQFYSGIVQWQDCGL